MRCMVECVPIKVLHLFCWSMTPFIFGLPYDHSHPSGIQQFAYKNFGCQAMANSVVILLVQSLCNGYSYYLHVYVHNFMHLLPNNITCIHGGHITFLSKNNYNCKFYLHVYMYTCSPKLRCSIVLVTYRQILSMLPSSLAHLSTCSTNRVPASQQQNQ